MNRSVLVVLCVMTTVLAAPALGQQQAGDLELQFLGSYYRTIGTEYTFGAGTISGKIGPYITDNLQIGLGPTLTISHMTMVSYDYDPVTFRVVEERKSETTTTFGTTAFVVYSFLTRGGKLVPYLGAQYFKNDFNKPWSEEPGSLGFNGGLKYFFARKTALDISGNYLFDLNKDSEGGLLLFWVGISFLF